MGGDGLRFREGSSADLAATFALAARAVHDTAARIGVVPPGSEPSDEEIERTWRRERSLLEFIAAQPDGRYLICENGDAPVGYARVDRFAEMEELTELSIVHGHHAQGLGAAILEQ